MAKYKAISPTNYKFSKKGKLANVNMTIDLGRLDEQYTRAQYDLDSFVMASMEPFMPMDTGSFIKTTKTMSQAVAGSGKVYAAAPPIGRYLYYGNVMVDEKTGSPYARKGARKVLVSQYGGKTNAREKIEFSRQAHPQASERWFEEAKKAHGHIWLQKIKQIAGGGKRG